MKNPEQSQINIGIELLEQETYGKDYYKEENDQLQRTEKWHKQRSGNWTSSIKKQLMSCGQGTARKSWNDKSKIYDFGKTALKAIYNAAMARRTGRYIDKGDGTPKMKYGTRVEPLIFTIAAEMLASRGILTEVGFKYFDDVPTAGVSTDGVLLNHSVVVKTPAVGPTTGQPNYLVFATYEAKATTNWETHFDRTFDLMDEKGTDFWQTQDHMTAYNVDVCYYAVSEPPHDINKYLYYDGDIMDLLDDFRKECAVSIQELQASEMHQQAGLKRIEIAEAVIARWNNKGGDLRKIMYEVIEQFKNSDGLETFEVKELKASKPTSFELPGPNPLSSDYLGTTKERRNMVAQVLSDYVTDTIRTKGLPKHIEIETGLELPKLNPSTPNPRPPAPPRPRLIKEGEPVPEPKKTEVNPEDLPF